MLTAFFFVIVDCFLNFVLCYELVGPNTRGMARSKQTAQPIGSESEKDEIPEVSADFGHDSDTEFTKSLAGKFHQPREGRRFA